MSAFEPARWYMKRTYSPLSISEAGKLMSAKWSMFELVGVAAGADQIAHARVLGAAVVPGPPVVWRDGRPVAHGRGHGAGRIDRPCSLDPAVVAKILGRRLQDLLCLEAEERRDRAVSG